MVEPNLFSNLPEVKGDADLIQRIEDALAPVMNSVHPMIRDSFRTVILDLCEHLGRPDLGENLYGRL